MSVRNRLALVLLVLFVLSGLAGLIYQSIWSHYLGLTLGHAAYAQALVLGIFMGGMALGAWLASRWTARLTSLIRAYAVVEAVIGVLGMAFHPLFLRYTELSQSAVLPALASPLAAHAYQWLSAALLIAPQCVLLGATFPLLSAGLLRLGGQIDGRILGGLYFTNSVGAAAGALVTTFLLLPAVGMPGSVLTAGLLNILVALVAWFVAKFADEQRPAPQAQASTAQDEAKEERLPVRTVLMIAAGITGATSFVYEIGWVRMLNQVLGTTIHAFELMLAAFIFGLACGGLWVRYRAARMDDPIRAAGHAQILMGIAALLSLVAFSQSFRWIGWLMQALQRSDEGYVLFSAGGAVVSLLVMFPAAFFAGMTLPLFTMGLLRRGGGESSIGRIYAANTLGAILGVLLMMHVLIPSMGIRLAVALAALLDAALGLYLIRRISPARRTLGYAVGMAATLVAAMAGLLLGRVDPVRQVSGVFRTGLTQSPDVRSVAFLKDGKTATVSVISLDGGRAAISTNGKPDAGLALSLDKPPTSDEVTMIMAGALPLVHHPSPKRIAVIGWGSGLTTHTLAGSGLPELIETVEIEPAMQQGAKLFGARVSRAYEDPRSVLRVEDARTYFATGNRKYDVIVSEPSNPWVSGVASLFTREFYGFVRRHLARDGILVQWIHAYELNDRLFGTMAAALLEVFPESEMYVTNTSDFIFVARTGARRPPRWEALASAPLAAELARVGLGSPEEFQLRRVAGPEALRVFVRHLGVMPYSDFFPVVSLNAPRSRFKQESANDILYLADSGWPVLDFLEGRRPAPSAGLRQPNRDSRLSEQALRANKVKAAVLSGNVTDPELARFGMSGQIASLLRISGQPVPADQIGYWSELIAGVAATTLGILPAEEQHELWMSPAWHDTSAAQPELVRDLLAMYGAVAARDAVAMEGTSMRLLRSGDFQRLGMVAREQVLVTAQLAAIGQARPQDVRAIDDRFGKGIPLSPALGYIRSYLLAWTDHGRARP